MAAQALFWAKRCVRSAIGKRVDFLEEARLEQFAVAALGGGVGINGLLGSSAGAIKKVSVRLIE